MMLILRLFISCSIALLLFNSAHAQVERFIPSHVRIGYDLGGLAYNLLSDDLNYQNFMVDTDINKFLFNVEYGTAKYQQHESLFDYDSKGHFYRVGLDYNFMYANKDFNALFFGLRYARSVFDDDIAYVSENTIETGADTRWPTETKYASNTDVKAGWVEANLGLRAKVFNNVYMGVTVRYKIKPSLKREESTFSPYYIPGFGKNLNSDRWNLAYFISYRIPLRKKKVYDDKKENKEAPQKPAPTKAPPEGASKP